MQLEAYFLEAMISEAMRDCRSSGIMKSSGSFSSARAETLTPIEGGSSSPTIVSLDPKVVLHSY